MSKMNAPSDVVRELLSAIEKPGSVLKAGLTSSSGSAAANLNVAPSTL